MSHTKHTMEFKQKSGKSKVLSNLLGHFNFFQWHHGICFDLPSKVQLSPHHQDEIKRHSVSSSSSSKVQVILHRDSTSDKEALQARIIRRCHNKLQKINAVLFWCQVSPIITIIIIVAVTIIFIINVIII